MRIYTSYFANMKNLQKAGIVCISIALYNPEWFAGHRLREAAPTPGILRLDEASYSKVYASEVLSRLDPEALLERIRHIAQGRDAALLCYETADKFCHRHLLADFLNRRTGAGIQEWYSPKQIREMQKAAMPEPPTLFD